MATDLSIMKEKLQPFIGELTHTGKISYYVFDKSQLSKQQLGQLLEYQLLGAYNDISEDTPAGRGWSTTKVPFALLNPEEDLEPEEMQEFDCQTMGVLFFDLANGNGETCPILICDDPSAPRLKPYKDSFEELGLNEE